MNFGIPEIFAYADQALEWAWTAGVFLTAFSAGYIVGGCAQRG